MQTIVFEAEGPISYIDTTTKTELFHEDRNRTILLHTDESDDQTRKVLHALARNTQTRQGAG